MSPLRLNRLARPVVALTVALALGACGSVTTPTAATVNDTEVAQDALLDEAAMVRDNDLLRQQQESQGGKVVGETDGSFDAAFVANLLQVRIYVALVEDELERRGVPIGDAELQASRAQVEQQFGGPEAAAQLPADFVDAQVRQNAVVSALGSELVGGDAESRYEEDPSQFDEVCLSHIFVNGQEAPPEQAEARANDLAAQLAAGTSFEQLASEQSDDPTAAAEQGSLGCGGRGRFIPEFEEAAFQLEVGEISDPVQTPVGFHIIRIESRTEQTFEEARDDILASLQSEVQPAIGAFLVEASADADIEVNPRFGTWVVEDGAPGRVRPPEGPAEAPGADDPLGIPVPQPGQDPTADPAAEPVAPQE